MPTVPGAIGAFRREALIDAGGVSDDTLAEDTDLTMAICRAGWRVSTRPMLAPGPRRRPRWGSCGGSATAGATAPCRRCGSTAARCGSGRGRQARPARLCRTCWRSRSCCRCWRRWSTSLPSTALVFNAWSPKSLWVWLGFLACSCSPPRTPSGWTASPRPLWSLPLQQFVYRQLMYLVVIQSLASALYGLRLHWQVMQRTGELDAAPIGRRHLTSRRAGSPGGV